MYLKVQDINIYYEKHGNKPQPIFILPGWGNNRNTFDYLINFLKEYFTIYIIDYPGFGNSNYPNQDLTIFDYANLINEIIKKLQIQNAILIGHSFGGRIIALLTTIYNTKFKKILLIDVAGIKPPINIKLFLKTKIYKLLKKVSIILPTNIKIKYLNILFQKFSSSDYKNLDKRLFKTFQNIVSKYLNFYYQKIKLETLILWGEYDNITPYKDALKLNKLIKNSTLIKIENTKHFPYLEKKYLVSKIIFEYLKKDIIT